MRSSVIGLNGLVLAMVLAIIAPTLGELNGAYIAQEHTCADLGYGTLAKTFAFSTPSDTINGDLIVSLSSNWTNTTIACGGVRALPIASCRTHHPSEPRPMMLTLQLVSA